MYWGKAEGKKELAQSNTGQTEEGRTQQEGRTKRRIKLPLLITNTKDD